MSTREMVEHVSMLARLRYQEEKKEEVGKNLEKVLSYVEQLGGVKADEVEPLYSPLFENMKAIESQVKPREDKVSSSLSPDEILQNAPEKKQSQFVVHAVIDEN